MNALLRSLRTTSLRSTSFFNFNTPRFISTSHILKNIDTTTTTTNNNNVESSIPLPRLTKKRENSRKTFLVDVYKHFWDNNQIVLICHRGNYSHTEQQKLVTSLSQFATMRVIKTSIFKYFLRASNHPDPASKEASTQVFKQKIRHPLEPALHGQSCVILIKDLDPKKVKSVLNIIKSQRERLFLVAAKVGNDIFDVEKTNQFKDLPNLPELQMQLVSTIQHLTVAGLIPTLSHNANTLHFSLQQFVDGENKPAEETETEATTAEKE